MKAEQLNHRFGQVASGLAAVTVLLFGTYWFTGLPMFLERLVFDYSQRAHREIPHDVVLVGIDADSKSHLGEWPWPNSLHAELIEQLRRAGSKTIVFTSALRDSRDEASLDRVRAAMAILQSSDVSNNARIEQLRKLLSGATENLDDDAQLARAMKAHGGVYIPVEISFEPSTPATHAAVANTLVADAITEADADAVSRAQTAHVISAPSSTFLAAARGFGHLANFQDSDGVVRRELAAVAVNGRLVPSLAIVAAAAHGDGKLRFTDNNLNLGGQRDLSLENDLVSMPRYLPASGDDTVPKYSYWEVLAGKVDADRFAHKIVIVGFTDGPNADRIATPLGPNVPRIYATAGTVQSFISGDNYRRPGWSLALQGLIALAILAVATLCLSRVSFAWGAALTGSCMLVLIAAEVALLNHGIWLQTVVSCLAILGALLVHAIVEKKPGSEAAGSNARTHPDGLRTLALTLQGQGQLDLAYETFLRCPKDPTTLDLLYRLGADFERRRQTSKAADVYAHIASFDAGFRDAKSKSERLAKQDDAHSDVATIPVSQTDSSARSSGAKTSAAAPKTRPVASSKETLGRYEIERQIGKGAMGVVYLGRDPKINRIVAIKAIPLAEEFEDTDLAEARERFFREAEMAGRLNHPGIVTVYDAGEDRGLAYIAMEYLRGEHLSFYAEPQTLLPVRKVLLLAARLADALDYAHRQNVVHRDIKPANIMFNLETDMLKITDFGIARLTDASRTKTGIVLGTPSFMSPEQLEGRPIDGRSDLFALGVTLYQLLSAQLPFRADSMTRLMNKIATEPHTPIRSIRPELPASIETIIERALAKSADLRFQTGAEMAAALRAVIQATGN